MPAFLKEFLFFKKGTSVGALRGVNVTIMFHHTAEDY